MPNSISETGLTTTSYQELIDSLVTSMQSIYGSDINVGTESPDGQMLNIFAQAAVDNLDLITQIYNSFDPDKAIGNVLDARVAINGIQRQAGTYTTTMISITTTSALNLYGLDQDINEIFTVQDNVANKWQLSLTQNISAAGTYSLKFQSAIPGAITTTPNTITLPSTIVLGVTTINNPTTYLSLGIDEESDYALRIRRQKSVSLASQGYLKGLLAAILNISGVNAAIVYENNTDSTDSDGVGAHSIWVIVGGTGSAQEIANAIYTKRNAGAGMKGAITSVISQVDGSSFVVRWDEVIEETLYAKLTISSLDGVNTPDVAAIRAGILANFNPSVYEQVNINDLATLAKSFDSNALISGQGFCLTLGGTYADKLTPSSKNKQFKLYDSTLIIT